MAGPREKLHDLMRSVKGLAIDPILEDYAIYYQAPPKIQMVYPCIRYELDKIWDRKADNKGYNAFNRYIVTVIDRNPDSTIAAQLLQLVPMCSFDRSYVSDNLYHRILTIYY